MADAIRNCSRCDVGWYGAAVCWFCGRTDTVRTGLLGLGEKNATEDGEPVRPPAPDIDHARPAIDDEHRPFWAFWRRAA